MSSNRFLSSDTVPLEWYAQDSTGAALPSKADLEVYVQRRSNDEWVQFPGLTFGASKSYQALTETEAGVSALYAYDFDLSALTGATADDSYRVFFRQNGGSDAVIPAPVDIFVDGWIDDAVAVTVTTVAGAIRNAAGAGVIANELFLKVGDLLPELTGTLYQDGVVFDLTGWTLQVRWRNLDTGAISTKSATVVSATSGTVKYTWASGDTADEGRYEYEWVATRTSDSKVQTFPGNDYKFFTIEPILD